MRSGIINVYKELGWTSSDVVVKLRRILGIKKIGHTGTLDPMAEGVLPVCVGRATQLSDYIMDKDKVYLATLKLGISTDTQDTAGAVLHTQPCAFTQHEIEQACQKFIGEIEQVPPMYSAIKQNGKKLYELARQGVVVERKPRQIRIDSIQVVACVAPDEWVIRVFCSKGTYIRTLCADIGTSLGVGGHMKALVREACGSYELENALRITEIEQRKVDDDLSFITNMEQAVQKFPRADVLPNFRHHFLNGLDADFRRFTCEQPLEAGDIVRVYIQDELCALGQLKADQLHIKCLLTEVDNGQ